MSITQSVHCPNCGSWAERSYLTERSYTNNEPEQHIKTECHVCDYLLTTGATSGRVIEAYAPGIYPNHHVVPCRNSAGLEIALKRSPLWQVLAS